MKNFKILLVATLISFTAFAGLPPTTSEGVGDSRNITTFNFQFPNFQVSRTGITSTFGILNPSGGGLGADFSANTGILRDTAGVFSAGLIDLATDTNSTVLPLAKGGTDFSATSQQNLTNHLIPFTNQGDMLTEFGGNATRFSIGPDGSILTASGGLPSWLAPGPDGYQLQMVSGVPAWTSTPTPAPPVPTPSPGIEVVNQQAGGQQVTTLTLPNYQGTVISGGNTLVETGNGNVLNNPSFQSQNANDYWSLPPTGVTPSTDTTNFLEGVQSLKLTLSSASGTILSQCVTPTAQIAGQTWKYSLTVKTSVPGVSFCAAQDGSVVGQCEPVVNDGLWHTPSPIIYPASGVSNCVELVESSSQSGVVNVAAGYVGPTNSIANVQQAQVLLSVSGNGSTQAIPASTPTVVTNWATPTILNGGTFSSGVFTLKTSGICEATASVWYNNTLTAGGVANARIFKNGTAISAVSANFDSTSANPVSPPYSFPCAVGDTIAVSTENFGTASANISGDSTVQIFNIKLFPNQQQSVISQNAIYDATGTDFSTDLPCPSGTLLEDGSAIPAQYTHLIAIRTAAGLSSPSTLPDMRGLFERGAGTNGTLAMANGTKYSGPMAGGTQLDEMQGHVHGPINNSTGGTAPANIITAPTTSIGGSSTSALVGTTSGSPISDGTNGTPRTGPETRGANMGKNFCMVANGVVGMPVQVQSVISSDTTGVEVVNRAKLTCSSSSSIVSPSGNWLASIGNISNGTCAVTINAGIFSDTPTCSIGLNQPASSSVLVSFTVHPTSSTALTVGGVFITSGSTTVSYLTSANFDLICNGPK